MDPEKRKLLILAGVGVVVLYLFSRAKSSSPTKTAAANDPLQGVAQQLAAQRAGQQASLDYAKAQVQNNIDITNSQFAEFKALAADKSYACPNGGRPRWIAGQGPGCIGPKTHDGGFFGDLLGAVAGWYTGGRVTGSGGSGGGSPTPYTPPIRGNSFF